MKLLNPIIDKLQELFPPNRVAILLAGVITAVSGSIAAWTAAHFPGLGLGQIEIAGVLGAAVIITVRLLDRWFDRWQKGEEVDYQADVEAAIEELGQTPEIQAFFEAVGTFDGLGKMIAGIRARIDEGTINEAQIDEELLTVLAVIEGFLSDNRPEALEELEEAAEAVPEPEVAERPAPAVAEPAAPAPPAE